MIYGANSNSMEGYTTKGYITQTVLNVWSNYNEIKI